MSITRTGLFAACLCGWAGALIADPAPADLIIKDGGKLIIRSEVLMNNGNLVVEDGGILELSGYLGVGGDIEFSGDSTLKLVVGGGQPGEYGFIGASGAVTVGGNLDISVLSSFTGRAAADGLELLKSNTTILGAFSNVAAKGVLTLQDGGSAHVDYSGMVLSVGSLVRGLNSSYAFTVVHATGDTVNGEPGSVTFNTFGVPDLYDDGEDAFSTQLKTDAGLVPAVIGGINTSVVARKGDQPYGNTGPAFATFGDPMVNATGETVFTATLSGTGVTSANKTGLWANIGGSSHALIVREGDPATGIPNGKIKTLISAGLTSTGEIPYVATLTGPGISGLGLYLYDGTATTLLLRQGVEETFLNEPARTVKTFSTLAAVPGSPGQGRSAVGEAVTARVTFTDGVTALAELTPNVKRLVAKSGETVPTAPAGAKYASFGLPAYNSTGDIAFLAKLARAKDLVTSTNDQAIYADTTAGDSTLIARTGTLAPDAEAARFKSFADPVYNTDREVAFIGTLTKGGTGIWWYREGRLQRLARKSARPAGLPVNAEWDSFTSVALPDGTGPVFLAKMRTGRGGVTSKSNIGIWATDTDGQLRLIARTGMPVSVNHTVKTVTALTFLPVVLGTPDHARGYNTEQQLTFKATFSDKTQAILRVTLP